MHYLIRVAAGLALIAAGTAIGLQCGRSAIGLIAFTVLTVCGTGAVSFSCCHALEERGYL